MGKVKVASVWLGGCAGCHMSFLDLDERLFDLAQLAEITFSPITDIKEPPPVDVGLVEGAVTNTDNEHFLKMLRESAKFLIAFGDCACTGNIPAMRNMFPLEEVLERGYVYTESTQIGEIPHSDEVPKLFDQVKPIDEYVKVDYYIPGCPPDADTIFYVLTELVAGRVPVLKDNTLRYD